MFAVAEVKDESDEQPDDQPHPVSPAQAINHRTANNDSQRRDYRHGRHAEAALEVRSAHAHDPHARANQDESEECADARHFSGNIGRNKCREETGEDKEEPVRLIRRAKTRVDIGKSFWDQAIAAHGEEDARLTEEHHENYRRP